MRSRILLKWSVGLAFGLLPLVGGSQQQASSPTTPIPTVAGTTSDQPLAPETVAPDQPTAGAADATADQLANAPVTLITTNKPPPPNIRPNSPVADLVKLANSGVDESVMLGYVNSCGSTFNLQADEIIYLNDIGIPAAVMTAMLQHDQNFAANQPARPPDYNSAPPPDSATVPPPDYNNAAPPAEAPLTPPAAEDAAGFYNTLAPYGNWVDVAGYGPCWQPTVVIANPGWQPYFDGGHWVYTDCGWYWMSDYSWGWAPFHYGRWFRHDRLGWCWAPDHVWGPSWVSWRYSDDYCGWAPLPPGVTFSVGFGLGYHGHHLRHGEDFGLAWNHYRFVPWQSFREHHLHGRALGGHEAQQVFHHTVAVNRVVAGHRTVINEGVSAARVAVATHQVIEPVKLRDMGAPGYGGGRVERFNPNNRTLAVYRPQASALRNGSANSGGRAGFRPSRGSSPSAWQAGSERSPASSPQATANAPLILRGREQISPRTQPAPNPSSSLVVIGREQNGWSQTPYRTPTAATAAGSAPRGAGNEGRTEPGRDSSRATPWLETRPGTAASPPSRPSAPTYSAPTRPAPSAPQYRPAPAYGTQRSYAAPAPAYRPQPAPSYSARSAGVPRSAPAPSYSSSGGGARSTPAPSYSGGGGGGRSYSAPSAPSGHNSQSSSARR